MTNSPLQEQLIDQIKDAHAMETNVHAQLDKMIADTTDPSVLSDLKHHLDETERHQKLLADRLTAYDTDAGLVKELSGLFGAFGKAVVDGAKGTTSGQMARDAYATEHFEIATYQLLERTAQFAGDNKTVDVAQKNRADEEAMAKKISSNWDSFAALELADHDVALDAEKSVPA